MLRFVLAIIVLLYCVSGQGQIARADSGYLDAIKIELQKKWPDNRTVNLVFHGHSVPSGYYTKGVVHTFGAYPLMSLKKIKENYKYAVINAITTAIGGEQSEQGAKRFFKEVLNHRPEVIFLDYALNDRSIGLERSKKAWGKMIEEAKEFGAKIILMTPTPDLNEDILSNDAALAAHSEQIRQLAKDHQIGLVDSYARFRQLAKTKELKEYMSQNNHINEKGHELVSDLIVDYFPSDENQKN